MERRRGLVWFVLAGVCGVVHASASLYWAFGGSALLETVGTWTFEMRAAAPIASSVALAAIGVAKLAAAVIPVFAELGRMPWPRIWRGISWVGGSVILVWGSVVAAQGWLQVAGAIPTADMAGAMGRAVLWEPLFAIWGALLLIGLARSRRRAVSRGR